MNALQPSAERSCPVPAFSRADLSDLATFAAVVRRCSFKQAAIELGVTGSAVSHAVRRLEERLGVKLLNRTSRAVAPSAPGLELARQLEDGFGRIGLALAAMDAARDHPLGELRLNVPRDAGQLLIGPALPELAERYPALRVSIAVADRPVDIVAEGVDAGIRYGDNVPRTMVAVALTPPLSWVMVASPAYLAAAGRPERPADLRRHRCLRLMLGDNTLFRWELGSGKDLLRLDVPGLHAINDTQLTIDAAVGGLGIAYVLERRVARELRAGLLEVVLPDWASPSPGLHMYYPSRRHAHPALRPLADIIRRQNGLPSLLRTRSR
jgi:DNA-binding transcriptional LysR family regulator